MVLWISRGKCRVDLWGEIIIIIRKTASTFHNGLAATNENLVLNFANNGDFTPRYPSGDLDYFYATLSPNNDFLTLQSLNNRRQSLFKIFTSIVYWHIISNLIIEHHYQLPNIIHLLIIH